MKLSLEKYLIYSSVFIIFSEAFFFNYIIDWKLMYLIMFANYYLLFRYFSVKIQTHFVLFLLFALVHAVVCYSIIQIPPNFFLSQLLGIAVTSTYFYSVLSAVDIEKVKNVYFDFSFYAAVIGYVFYFTDFNALAHFDNERRLISVFKEPAHYVVVVVPACYYFLKTKAFLRFFVVFSSILASTSSLGIVGCGLMFALPYLNWSKIKYFVGAVPILAVVFYFIYQEMDAFKMRVDETAENLTVLENGKFNNYTNLSSYVLLSNMYIAKQNIIEHPFGSGIGSHHYMYTKHYYETMRPPEYLITIKHNKDNSFDANSLFTRLISEFGIFGICFIVISVIFLFRVFKYDDFLLHGIFIYFVLKLMRDGTYFPPEFYFFVWLFYFSNKKRQENIIE